MTVRYISIKSILIVIVALTLLTISMSEYSFAGYTIDVKRTPHNLGNTGQNSTFVSTDETEICVFCHTPHRPGAAIPLWNHYSTDTGKQFYLYSSGTIDATIPDTIELGSASLLCMGCHDGTTGLNSLVNPSGTLGRRPAMEGGTGGDQFSDIYPSASDMVTGRNPNFGTDLRNSHPVNFDFSNVNLVDNKIKTLTEAEAGGLRFFGPGKNMMECPTCHNPHVYTGYKGSGGWFNPADYTAEEKSYKPFLRRRNRSSALCLTCHIK